MGLFFLDAVSFSYPGQGILLESCTLQMDRGEHLGISGSIGTGKSTLLHLCTGLITPHKGRVLFHDVPLITEADWRTARREMGYLLQRSDDQLFCPTVLEDVAFGPLNYGVTSKEARSLAMETLEALSISHLAGRAGCSLSGGEQTLAALATIWVLRPTILFLDEPVSHLDPHSRDLFCRFLSDAVVPFISISHDQSWLHDMCSKVYVLQNGQLHAS